MSFLYLGFCHYILPFSAVKNGKTLLPRIIVAVCSANNIAITISLGRQESTVLRYRDSRTQHAGAQIPFRSSVTLGKLRNFPVPSLSYPQNGDNSVCLVLLWSAAAAAKSLQSCPTLCDPIDGSPPGSPVPGILQARKLEWVAISFSNG